MYLQLLPLSPAPGTKHPTFFQAVQKIWNASGALGFFRSNGLNVMKIVPEDSLKYYTFEKVKTLLTGGDDSDTVRQMTSLERVFAGGLAGLVSQSAVYPLDVVKVRWMDKGGGNMHLPDIFKLIRTEQMARKEPIYRGYYRGLTPNLLGAVPYIGFDMAMYDTLKNKMMNANREKAPSTATMLTCGSISSTVATLGVYPVALLRCRLQAGQYDGFFDAWRKTLAREGWRGMYKGVFPALLKVVPARTISYVAYEWGKQYMQLK